jgi:hypothetical protein
MGWNFGLALLAALIKHWPGGDKPGGSAGRPSSNPRPPGGKPTGAAAQPSVQPSTGRGK